MDVQVQIPAWEMGAIQITHNQAVDLKAQINELSINDSIETDTMKLAFKNVSDSSIQFELEDKISGESD